MNSANPAAVPAILLTDNPNIAELFNDQKYQERGALQSSPSLASVIGDIRNSFPESSLFLSTQNTGFISLDVECMLDSSPRASVSLYETSEFFELRILRSATANLIAQKNEQKLGGVVAGPTRTFYIAFGLGDDLDYWAPFSGYQLIGAETYDNFDEARRITLEFAAGFGLGDFSTDALRPFVNPDIIQAGHISIFDKFKPRGSDGKDSYRLRLYNNVDEKILARREHRFKTLPFYIASLDNLIDKTLQTIFNTNNVLVLTYHPPYAEVEKFISEQNNTAKIDLEVEYSNILKLTQPPRAGSEELKRLRAFSKIMEDISSFFGINMVPAGMPPQGGISTIQEKTSKDDEKYTIQNLRSLGYSLNSDKTSGRDKDVINEILNKFRNGYNQLLGTDSYCYVREADLSVLKEVDLAIQNDFGKSFFEKSEPLIIFGPKELIANYFYGRKYPTTLLSDFAKTPQNVERTTERKLNSVFNLYNSQNINDTTLAKLLEDNQNIKNKINNLIKTNRYPVFKYNMQNSNVISIKISDNKAYFLLLNQAFTVLNNYASIKTTTLKDPFLDLKSQEEEEIDSVIKNSQFKQTIGPRTQAEQKLIDDSNDKQISDIVEKCRQKRSQIFAYKLSNATNKERLDILLREGPRSSNVDDIISSSFSGKPGPISRELAAIKSELFSDSVSVERKLELLRSDRGFNEEYLAQEAEKFVDFMKEKYGLITVVEDAYASDPLKFFVDLLETLDKVIFQVEIETLPFFPISNFTFLLSPCLLFAQRPGFIGDTKTRNPLDSISGGYNILGYHHTIDTSKVTSTFKLFSLPEKGSD